VEAVFLEEAVRLVAVMKLSAASRDAVLSSGMHTGRRRFGGGTGSSTWKLRYPLFQYLPLTELIVSATKIRSVNLT
jgi:hypothetical protein